MLIGKSRACLIWMKVYLEYCLENRLEAIIKGQSNFRSLNRGGFIEICLQEFYKRKFVEISGDSRRFCYSYLSRFICQILSIWGEEKFNAKARVPRIDHHDDFPAFF